QKNPTKPAAHAKARIAWVRFGPISIIAAALHCDVRSWVEGTHFPESCAWRIGLDLIETFLCGIAHRPRPSKNVEQAVNDLERLSRVVVRQRGERLVCLDERLRARFTLPPLCVLREKDRAGVCDR